MVYVVLSVVLAVVLAVVSAVVLSVVLAVVLADRQDTRILYYHAGRAFARCGLPD